jgi:hypothetical protein
VFGLRSADALPSATQVGVQPYQLLDLVGRMRWSSCTFFVGPALALPE